MGRNREIPEKNATNKKELTTEPFIENNVQENLSLDYIATYTISIWKKTNKVIDGGKTKKKQRITTSL